MATAGEFKNNALAVAFEKAQRENGTLKEKSEVGGIRRQIFIVKTLQFFYLIFGKM
ncbi:MAG: hypothetical protein PUD43_07245 [Clostridia bacterium]|nr:hypothetical protein [Clostridia bacterium]